MPPLCAPGKPSARLFTSPLLWNVCVPYRHPAPLSLASPRSLLLPVCAPLSLPLPTYLSPRPAPQRYPYRTTLSHHVGSGWCCRQWQLAAAPARPSSKSHQLGPLRSSPAWHTHQVLPLRMRHCSSLCNKHHAMLSCIISPVCKAKSIAVESQGCNASWQRSTPCTARGCTNARGVGHASQVNCCLLPRLARLVVCMHHHVSSYGDCLSCTGGTAYSVRAPDVNGRDIKAALCANGWRLAPANGWWLSLHTSKSTWRNAFLAVMIYPSTSLELQAASGIPRGKRAELPAEPARQACASLRTRRMSRFLTL